MKDYHINIFYSDQDEGYIADIPDLKYAPHSVILLKRLFEKFKLRKRHGLKRLASKANRYPHLDINQLFIRSRIDKALELSHLVSLISQ